MNYISQTRRSFKEGAFTLIELLVVITIIAVLAGLLLPVGQRVLENTKKVSTKATETQIISAINTYQGEYGQYPVSPPAGDPTDVTLGLDDANANHVLFDVLRALNSPDKTTGVLLNPRRISYFESKNVKNINSARDGFIPANAGATVTGNPKLAKPVKLSSGDLVDSWGNMYIIRMDSGYTNALVNPYTSLSPAYGDTDTSADAADINNDKIIRTGVISWTYGYDGLIGAKGATIAKPYAPTPGDDVDSWQ